MDHLQVVCSQVLCAPAVEAPGGAYYGEGTGTIWMDNVHCTAQDDALEDCRFNGWGNHNCRHSKDAGVRCGGTAKCIHWYKCILQYQSGAEIVHRTFLFVIQEGVGTHM